MSWVRRHRIRRYLASSLWIMPLAGIVLAAAPLVRGLDAATRWTLLGFTPEGARTALGALVASTLGFIVFAFSMILLAVQIASGQLTPRIIAGVLRERSLKVCLAVFIFTNLYAIGALARIEDDAVPQLHAFVAILLSLVSVCLFLFLIDHVARMLRPASIIGHVAAAGLRAIARVYPRPLTENAAPSPGGGAPSPTPVRTVRHTGPPGVLVAFDAGGLAAVARRADAVIALVPRAGDFVATEAPLFHLLSGGDGLRDDDLRDRVALAAEWEIHQDPAFAFRIIVDIASKALSPAINDPTTAVIAIDHLQHLLTEVAHRELADDGVGDATGQRRLVVRTPDWDDYVSLAVTEIRLYGGSSIQVVRRLRAMLESLVETLPPGRAATLGEELDVLHRMVARLYLEPADLARADAADTQGMGV